MPFPYMSYTCMPPCSRMGSSLTRHLLQLLKPHSSFEALFTTSNVTTSLKPKLILPSDETAPSSGFASRAVLFPSPYCTFPYTKMS